MEGRDQGYRRHPVRLLTERGRQGNRAVTRPGREPRKERRPIGIVQALYRYPLKSMQGERLREVDIDAQGVIGDRAYALREANGRVMTAKKWPTLLDFAAHYEAPPTRNALAPLVITLPDGRTILAEDPDASAVFSAVLGHPVVLERAQGDQHHRAAIDPAMVFGDVPVESLKPEFTAATLPDSFALPPGTFFDAASIHVLASGTLAHLRTLIGGDAPVDARRFRPNIVIETESGLQGVCRRSLAGWHARRRCVRQHRAAATGAALCHDHPSAGRARAQSPDFANGGATSSGRGRRLGGHWHPGNRPSWGSGAAGQVSRFISACRS